MLLSCCIVFNPSNKYNFFFLFEDEVEEEEEESSLTLNQSKLAVLNLYVQN